MRACHVVEIVTPKKVMLNGLWFGPLKPKRAIVWVHGLGSSLFGKEKIIDSLVDEETAVLTFNNRGFERVAEVAYEKCGQKEWMMAGSAHEVFVDCPDDVQGAINYAKKKGAPEVYLAGHSTGCQKSIYWASKNNGGRAVKGIILLAPVSDYSAEMRIQGKVRVAKAERLARALIKRKQPHTLLPDTLWHEPVDAQRFLSLYTKDSEEEIFCYADPDKVPKALTDAKVRILVLWAQNDEFSDMPVSKIASWFSTYVKSNNGNVVVIPKVGHSFRGGEKAVVREIKAFCENIKVA